MEYIFIYLLQIAESLETIKIIMWILIGLGAVPVFVFSSSTDKEEREIGKKFKNFWLCGLIIAILATTFPTKQTLLLVGGTYIGKKTVNSIVTSEKLQKIDTIINLELDKRIKELKKDEVQND